MRICFTLFSLLLAVAEAQIYNVTSYWSFNQTQLDSFVAALNRTTEDKWLYHWGNFADGIRWARQGMIEQEEMNALDAGHGTGGGGFYLSTDKLDSSSYGTWPSIVLLPKGTLVFESNERKKTAVLMLLLGKTTPLDERAEKPKLGAIVPFWDEKYSNMYPTWSVCHNAQVIKKIMPAFEAPVPLYVSMDQGEKFELPYNGVFQVLQQIEEKTEYKNWSNTTEIRRLIQGVRYLGPVETLCRLKSSDPSSFLRQIDTPHFHRFQKFLEWALSHNATNPLNIGNGRIWGRASNLTRSEWAKRQVDELMPAIQDMLHGNVSGEISWRGEEKCAHGGQEGLQVEDIELKTLMSNVYITVEILRRNDTTRRSWVKWCYPNALNYNSSHVSNETHALIKSYPREKIEQNSDLRTKLNKILLKDMTTQFLLQLYATTQEDGESPVEVFESFMPAEDMSSIRWWSWLAMRELSNYLWTGTEQDIEMKGMELLLPQYNLTVATGEYQQKLYSMEMALVNRLILSIYHNTAAPSQEAYLQSLGQYNQEFTRQFMNKLEYTAEQCDMMLMGRWTELFDSIGVAI